MNLSTTYHYIGTGELGLMYTLRQYVLHVTPGQPPQVSDTYVCNLATNPDTAIAKAKERVSDLNLSVGLPQLGEIQRSAPRSPEEIEAIRLAEEASAARRAEEILAAQANLIKRHPIVGELLNLSVEGFADVWSADFLRSLAEQVARKGDLSDRQIDALADAMTRYRDETTVHAPAEPLTAGRRELAGSIVSFKWVEGYYGDTLKMLVRLDDGNKVFGTVPASLDDDAEPGDQITFTAKVEPSRDDPHFGFFSRPTKATTTRSPT